MSSLARPRMPTFSRKPSVDLEARMSIYDYFWLCYLRGKTPLQFVQRTRQIVYLNALDETECEK